MIDLKEYKEQPDEGLFEKIQRRLAIRRAVKIGGTVLAGIVVVAVAISAVSVLSLQDKRSADQPQYAAAMESPTAVAVAENSEATTTATAADIATERPVRITEVMPIDTTAEVAEAMLPREATNDSWISTEEVEAMIRQVESTLPKEKPAARTETVANNEAKPADTPIAAQEAKATESSKAGVQNPHYDNIIWAPNIILPNGEVEENRVFQIKSTSAITNFNMQIFNRRGQRVYNTADPSFSWDAASMPQGGYVWVATFRDSDGHPRQEKGTVVVVR